MSDRFDAPAFNFFIVASLLSKALRNSYGNSALSKGWLTSSDTASSISTAFIFGLNPLQTAISRKYSYGDSYERSETLNSYITNTFLSRDSGPRAQPIHSSEKQIRTELPNEGAN